MMWSAPGTILKYTQLDFSVSMSHLLFSFASQSHFCVSCWPVCSTQPCQVRCLLWLLDWFPKRSKPIWLIMCLFVCKTVLANFIKVWKENNYPKGHRVEEATPSERPTLPQAHLGREAAAALQAADYAARTSLQTNGGRVFLAEGVWAGSTLLCSPLLWWVGEQGLGDRGHEQKAKQGSELCVLQNSSSPPPPTVLFHVTSTPSTEQWQHDDLCRSGWLHLFKRCLVVANQ